jgi:hypothetical protein
MDMFICCVGSGLCDELLTRSEPCLVCVCVCERERERDLENYDEAALPRPELGCRATEKKKMYRIELVTKAKCVEC